MLEEYPGQVGEGGAAAKMPQESLLATVRTPDPGKPAAGVAAVEVALHDLFDDRPEKTVRFLEASLIIGQERLEMMEKHPIRNPPCAPDVEED